MDKKIIIINGTGGSGKDSFVNIIAKYKKVVNYSTITKIKDIAVQLGWDSSFKNEKDRKFLSDLKQLSINYNDLPYFDTLKIIDEFLKTDKDILFIHIKEIAEIKKLLNHYEKNFLITLLIKRTNYDNIVSNNSDKNVDNFKYDYVIYNDTLEKFEKEAQMFLQNIYK